jgi:tetratricopeptide (TPR) repeat protein
MDSFESTTAQLQRLLELEQVNEAELLVDQLADKDEDWLGREWELHGSGVRHYLSIFYNNIGLNYKVLGMDALRQEDSNAVMLATQGAERCHEKALDMYDMSAEDFMYLPSESPFNKNLILTFYGLGSVKFVLGKHDESRKYLLLSLRIPAEDEQALSWQADASRFLRLLDQKPIRLALKVSDIMPSLFNPQLFRVRGDLLEWDSYAPPTTQEYIVQVSDHDIDRLESQGFRNAIGLEGYILILESDESGDLQRPLRLIDVK